MIAVETRTDDGWILRGDLREVPAAPVVVCSHAMMVDRRTLDRPSGAGLASVLNGAGLEVLTIDARGHGESGPSARQGARWSYDDVVRFDVPAMVRLGRERAAGRPVAFVGHSLTGHAALISAGLTPTAAPDALVALAPNLWLPSLERSSTRRLLKGAGLALFGAATSARGYFDAPALGMGSDGEAAAYVAQFRSMWRADRLGYEAALARAELPVLCVAGGDDRLLAHPESVRAFAALAPRAQVQHRVAEGMSHMGLLTHRGPRPHLADVARWLLDTLR